MEIVDNFLPEKDFLVLQQAILRQEMPWYFVPWVGEEGKNNLNGHYFHNIFVDGRVENRHLLTLITKILEPKSMGSEIWRSRVISFPRTSEIIHHEVHTDAQFSHTGLLIYMNTNDGFTNYNTGEKVQSVANRALIHDGCQPHNSTTCTDSQRRVVLTINYL